MVVVTVQSQLKNSNVENFRDFIKLCPSVKQLISAIPNTLPLLDILVTKSLKLQKSNDDKLTLHYDELFNYLLWWVAYNEQKNIFLRDETSKVEINEKKQSENDDLFMGWEKSVRSILTAIQADNPSILDEARSVQLCFTDSLEALGCHGLINCSGGLVGLLDAVCFEMANHQKKLKEIAEKLRNMRNDKHQFRIPSSESHHRHVNSHLSQIYHRISMNKQIRDLLIKSLTNVNLNNLLRIVHRRLICDQTLIELYKLLANSAPTDYMIAEADPIVATVIVTFNTAYHKLLSLIDDEFNSNRNSSNSMADQKKHMDGLD
uniref:Uncharacterized protein n=1 Tax=Setaria digitata TaxID=48799 RepID=A0A915Q2I8_9BILA